MSIDVHIDIAPLQRTLDAAIRPDDAMMLFIASSFARYCTEYVPMETGTLSQTVDISKPGVVEWTQPYAHYLYEGEIYGPNIPIRSEAGTIIGYFSMPGRKKQPTGRALTYSHELHPLATDHWDRAAMAAHHDDLMGDIARYVRRRFDGDA